MANNQVNIQFNAKQGSVNEAYDNIIRKQQRMDDTVARGNRRTRQSAKEAREEFNKMGDDASKFDALFSKMGATLAGVFSVQAIANWRREFQQMQREMAAASGQNAQEFQGATAGVGFTPRNLITLRNVSRFESQYTQTQRNQLLKSVTDAVNPRNEEEQGEVIRLFSNLLRKDGVGFDAAMSIGTSAGTLVRNARERGMDLDAGRALDFATAASRSGLKQQLADDLARNFDALTTGSTASAETQIADILALAGEGQRAGMESGIFGSAASKLKKLQEEGLPGTIKLPDGTTREINRFASEYPIASGMTGSPAEIMIGLLQQASSGNKQAGIEVGRLFGEQGAKILGGFSAESFAASRASFLGSQGAFAAESKAALSDPTYRAEVEKRRAENQNAFLRQRDSEYLIREDAILQERLRLAREQGASEFGVAALEIEQGLRRQIPRSIFGYEGDAARANEALRGEDMLGPGARPTDLYTRMVTAPESAPRGPAMFPRSDAPGFTGAGPVPTAPLEISIRVDDGLNVQDY